MVWTRLFGTKAAQGGASFGSAEELQAIADLAAAGALRPRLDRAFPVDQIAAAHRYLEEARPRGEVVVVVDAAADPLSRRLHAVG